MATVSQSRVTNGLTKQGKAVSQGRVTGGLTSRSNPLVGLHAVLTARCIGCTLSLFPLAPRAAEADIDFTSNVGVVRLPLLSLNIAACPTPLLSFMMSLLSLTISTCPGLYH